MWRRLCRRHIKASEDPEITQSICSEEVRRGRREEKESKGESNSLASERHLSRSILTTILSAVEAQKQRFSSKMSVANASHGFYRLKTRQL